MIIVSSLEEAVNAFREHKPSHVVSILDSEEPLPKVFEALPPENHLKVIENCSSAIPCNNGANPSRCCKLIRFGKHWMETTNAEKPLLIHCHQGVARSTAAAYIMLCAIEQGQSEKAIAERLRSAAPHAEPNLLLVSEADAALRRHDRMVDAILDLCPLLRNDLGANCDLASRRLTRP